MVYIASTKTLKEMLSFSEVAAIGRQGLGSSIIELFPPYFMHPPGEVRYEMTFSP
jgi:hypothetical protein